MCYHAYVMLLGCYFCALSNRPTLSLFALSSLFRMLSPIIPAHPRNAPVSPIIPAHTQKQGVGGSCGMTNRFISGIFLTGSSSCGLCFSDLFSVLSVSSVVKLFSVAFPRSPRVTRHSLARRSFSGGGPPTPIIPAPLATAALRVVPAPIFTTTSRSHVGAPTFSPQERFLQRPEKSKSTGKNARATRGNVLNCKLLAVNCRPRFAGGGANFRSRLSLVVHTPLYAEVPRIQEHAYE